MRVGETMSHHVVSVPHYATLVEASELMRNHDIGFLPVTSSDMLVGVVTDRDIVVRGIGEGKNPYITEVQSVMSTKPLCCYEDDVLTDAADMMSANHVQRLVVIDDNNKLAGLLSVDDLAAHMSSDRALGDLLRNVRAA